ALLNEAAHGCQHAAALGGAHLAPGAGERCAGGPDGADDIAGAAARDSGEERAVGRVLERQRLAPFGRAPFAGDEEEIGRKRDHGADPSRGSPYPPSPSPPWRAEKDLG